MKYNIFIYWFIIFQASVITKLKINDKEDAFFAVKKLIEYGCKIVIITLGKNGAIFGNKETNIIDHISIEEVKPVDTTVSITN